MSGIGVGVTLAHGLGLMSPMALSVGSIERLDWPRNIKSLLIGFLFGAGALLAMLSPATIAPGIIIDARQIMLGVAAAFGGVPAAIVSATIASCYRVSLGGAGVDAGQLAIWIASAMGLLWTATIRRKDMHPTLRLLLLGMMIPVSLAASLVSPKIAPGSLHGGHAERAGQLSTSRRTAAPAGGKPGSSIRRPIPAAMDCAAPSRRSTVG